MVCFILDVTPPSQLSLTDCPWFANTGSAGWFILLGSSIPWTLSHCVSLASFIPRESKELADFARIHPSSCASNGLNSNLMVTGGPALAGSGRWSADPASHLAAHPWLPRTGSPSMWLAGHPYGECPGREPCPEGVHTNEIQGKVLLQPSEAV